MMASGFSGRSFCVNSGMTRMLYSSALLGRVQDRNAGDFWDTECGIVLVVW